MPVDLYIPTVDNPVWANWCLKSIMNNTNAVHVNEVKLLAKSPQTWLEKQRQALEVCTTELVMQVQDDCLIMPGNPNWIEEMARPFAVDPAIGVVACSVTAAGAPNQRVRTGHAPGFYYTTNFAPIIMLWKPAAWRDAIGDETEDFMCDQTIPLNLLTKGWKIVMCTSVAHYHEGMQTNLRVWCDNDPEKIKAWQVTAAARIKDEIPKRYPPLWCARLDASEMIPMVMP